MMSRLQIGMFVVLAACGKVEQPAAKDAAPSDTPIAIDGSVIDASPDAPPDAPNFFSGSLSFEELPQGSIIIPHTFANGVKLTRPTSGGTVTATDCGGNSGFYGFGCSTQEQYIPNGEVFIGMPNLGLNSTIIEFEFPANITQFSAAITNSDGSAGQTYNLTGLDLNANVKASSSITTVAITGWSANRGALSASAGFRKVTIGGNGANAIVFDEVRWVVP